MKTYQVNKEGYYGEFGGAYIPEILHRCVEELQNAYSKVLESEGFKQEFHQLLRDYVGRPSPLYLANRLSKKYGCKIYLKREDLNHTGAHKINNAIGQVLLAKRMGKKRIIAETGALPVGWRHEEVSYAVRGRNQVHHQLTRTWNGRK